MKRDSLLWKLIIAFVLVALISAALVALFIRMTSADRLTLLIMDQQRSMLVSSLTEYYEKNGSWDGIETYWSDLRWREARLTAVTQQPKSQTPNEYPNFGFGPNPGDPMGGPGGPERDRIRLFGLADANGKVLIPSDPKYPAGSTAPSDQLKDGAAITVNNQKVGTLMMIRLQPRFNPEENLFLQRTTDALIYASLGALLIAVLLGIFLARTLIRPLQALTVAARNIAQGEWEQEVRVTTHDEIGQLAAAFNTMSQEVTRVNQQRRQMTADIAHDLRTPLTVIAGYIESMRDGVLQPTNERLTLIYTEIERLQNLVNDLRMLSQVDAGELPLHRQFIDPLDLLERAAAPFQHSAEQNGIHLAVSAPDGLPLIYVDEARMMQVLSNLISNSMRYTPEGGEICLSAETHLDGAGASQMRLTVRDTGSGMPAEELPLIFDRFYRVDKSRSSGDVGETGLGLAIVKALVEAHGGKIEVESTLGKGTAMHLLLPVEK